VTHTSPEISRFVVRTYAEKERRIKLSFSSIYLWIYSGTLARKKLYESARARKPWNKRSARIIYKQHKYDKDDEAWKPREFMFRRHKRIAFSRSSRRISGGSKYLLPISIHVCIFRYAAYVVSKVHLVVLFLFFGGERGERKRERKREGERKRMRTFAVAYRNYWRFIPRRSYGILFTSRHQSKMYVFFTKLHTFRIVRERNNAIFIIVYKIGRGRERESLI